jgi:flagellar hook capping protein FlgD
MRPHPTRRARTSRWIVLGAAMLLCAAGPVRAGVQVGLVPAVQTVTPGSEFDIELNVTQAGSPFNGFDATVTFDPAALTFLAASPTTLQQGCLMTGACSAACGTTFHKFTAAADSQVITDILLCNQISLTGPGQIYKLHFRASNTPQVTHVRFRRKVFYNAGLYVNPVSSTDATVGIGVSLDVGDMPPLAGLRLLAEPNPSRGAITFAVESDASGAQVLEVHDVAGRMVRRLSSGWQEGGARRVAWDGTDASGGRLPAGIYLVTLRAGSRSAHVRVALID